MAQKFEYTFTPHNYVFVFVCDIFMKCCINIIPIQISLSVKR
jgi:hypothetical protein